MKKIIALLLAIMMIVSLTACGGSEKAPETQAPAAAAPEAAPAAPADNGKPYEGVTINVLGNRLQLHAGIPG